jgi:hypothetical protein
MRAREGFLAVDLPYVDTLTLASSASTWGFLAIDTLPRIDTLTLASSASAWGFSRRRHPHPRLKRERVGVFSLPTRHDNGTLNRACRLWYVHFFISRSCWLTTLLSPPTPSLEGPHTPHHPLASRVPQSPHAAPPLRFEGSLYAAPPPRSKREGVLLCTVNSWCSY